MRLFARGLPSLWFARQKSHRPVDRKQGDRSGRGPWSTTIATMEDDPFFRRMKDIRLHPLEYTCCTPDSVSY